MIKLPENKKDRIKILVFIGIGVVAVLYAVIQLLIVPVISSYRSDIAQLAEVREKLGTTDRELDRAPAIKKEHDEVVAKIDDYSERYVLRPVLGAYLIGVQSIIENLATNAGVALESVTEAGITDLPGNNKDGSKHAIKSYGVRIAAFAGYRELLSMIDSLEKSNPLLCISEIGIVARPLTPDAHQFGFSVEWPIWGETEKPAEPTNAPPAALAPGATAGPLPKGQWD